MSLKMEAASLREIKNRMIVIKDRIRDHEGFEITPNDIHPTAFGICVEMIFQLGKRGCMNFAKMHKAIAEKNFETASIEMLDSKWHKQTKARCESLAELMRNI